MPNFNARINEKLNDYPEVVREVARQAIELAKKLDAAKLANALEPKVKSIARRELNNDFTED